ncbi:MAG: hypothetical protein IPM21_02055 [Acidobacteria bacterium]|nr:hypothetical protein [Acidobacteriota bacterium]
MFDERPAREPLITRSWKIAIALYVVAVIFSFFYFPVFLAVLGLPFSAFVAMFGMLLIHHGDGSSFEWALLFSTFATLILLLLIASEHKIKKDMESE